MRGARVASESEERGSSGGESSRVRRTMVGTDAPGRAGTRKHSDARRGVRAKEKAREPRSACSYLFRVRFSVSDQIVPDRYV